MKQYLIALCTCVVLYTSTSGQAWTTLSDIPVKLAFPVVVELNGNIHVIGGGRPSGATSLHLRYQPKLDQWDTLQPVPYRAQQPGGAVLNNQIHYFGGGYPNSGSRLDDHYAYNPDDNSWRKMADLMIPRVIHKTATLGDSIFVLSGQPDKYRLDIFTANDSSWKRGNDLPDGNFWYSAIAVKNNQFYRFGGGGFTSAVTDAHRYNRTKNTWSAIASLSATNHAPSAAVLGDSIYIAGGYVDFRYTSQCLVYNVTNNTYGKGPTLPDPRSYHSMVQVGNCIYSVGGHNDGDTIASSLIRHCSGDPFSSLLVGDVTSQTFRISRLDDGRIQLHSDMTSDPFDLQFFDIRGSLVCRQMVFVNEVLTTLDKPPVRRGMYTLKITTKNGENWYRLPIEH